MYTSLSETRMLSTPATPKPPAVIRAIPKHVQETAPEGSIVSSKTLGDLNPIAQTLLSNQFEQVPYYGQERVKAMNILTRLAEHLIHIQETPLLQRLFSDEATRHQGKPAILAYTAGVLGQVYEQREIVASFLAEKGLSNLEFSIVAIGSKIDEIVREAKDQVSILQTLKTYRTMRSFAEVLCTTAQHYLDIQGSTYALISRVASSGEDFTFRTSGLGKQILPSPSETWNHPSARIETLQETQLAKIGAKARNLASQEVDYLQEALVFCFYKEAHMITIIANHLEAFYPPKFRGG